MGGSGNGLSSHASVSADGNTVAFTSFANNLVENDSNGVRDVFVRRLDEDFVRLISRSISGNAGNGGSESPVISSDGSTVAFTSAASDLVANDHPSFVDVFAHRIDDGVTTLVSVSARESRANGISASPTISADGNTIAFASFATNLVGDRDSNRTVDVFLRDLSGSRTKRISSSLSRVAANGLSHRPVLSADGRVVAFRSNASNLVAVADTNSDYDIFVHDVNSGATTIASLSTSVGRTGNGKSDKPRLSSDGSTVLFQSSASESHAER